MSDLFKNLIKKAKELSLTDHEKSLLLSNLRSVMKEGPLGEEPLESPYTKHFHLVFSRRTFVSLALIVFFLGVGSTGMAANSALPGDTLYPVKVGINERVESWVAISPDASARFEVVKAERRLKEVEKLTVKKKTITPETKEKIKENFTKSAEKVKEITLDIEAKGGAAKAAEVKLDFENKLEAHKVVLSKLIDEEEKIVDIEDSEKENIKEINALVDEQLSDLKNKDKEQDSNEDTKDEKENSDKESEKPTEENQEILDQVKDEKIPEDTKADKTEREAASKEEAEVSPEEKAEPGEVKEATQVNEEESAPSSEESAEDEAKEELDPVVDLEVQNILEDLDLSD